MALLDLVLKIFYSLNFSNLARFNISEKKKSQFLEKERKSPTNSL